MNYRIKNYTISDFISSSSNSEVHTEGAVDVSFLSTYVKRNEINQNLQNAPLDNQPNIPSSPFSHYHYHHHHHDPTMFRPWRPSKNLILLLEEFDKKILHDFPSIPCAYCSILMMSASIKWIGYNADEEYTLKIAFPNERLDYHWKQTIMVRSRLLSAHLAKLRRIVGFHQFWHQYLMRSMQYQCCSGNICHQFIWAPNPECVRTHRSQDTRPYTTTFNCVHWWKYVCHRTDLCGNE